MAKENVLRNYKDSVFRICCTGTKESCYSFTMH